MKLDPRHRWMLLATLLTLAMSAAAWVSDAGKSGTEVVDAPPRPPQVVTTTTLSKEGPSIHLQKLLSRSATSRADDAFPPHSWRKLVPPAPVPVAKPVVSAPPPVVAAQPVLAAPPPPPPPPPPRAPPLPFVYLGKIQSEEANAVFLGLGERNLIVHSGDVIDSMYRVDVLSDAGLTFTHLPTGIQQNLPIGAPK